ncbi:MAG: T9SS type A sorting domain-containing protein [Saprospiraceae bacterium]
MRKFIFLLSFIGIAQVNLLNAQCNPAPSDDCESAPLLCSIAELNGYNCHHITYSNPNGCSPLCPSGGSSFNTSWWNFLGHNGQACVTITVGNCNINGQGLQIGVTGGDCCENFLYCDVNCLNSGSKSFCFPLFSCNTYKLFINGCSGDACDFSLQTSGSKPDDLVLIKSLDGPVNVCQGPTKVKYTETEISNPNCFFRNWTLSGVHLDSDSKSIELTFPLEGDFELCFNKIFKAYTGVKTCVASNTICKTIKVRRLPSIVQLTVKVCEYYFPFEWGGNLVEGPGTYSGTFLNGNCLQDSTKIFVLISNKVDPCKQNSFVSGIVYYDIDRNGLYNMNLDVPASGVIITNDQGNKVAVSEKGNYSIEVEKNELNTIKTYASAGLTSIASPSFYLINVPNQIGQIGGNYNFAIQLNDSVDLEVNLNISKPRAGSTVIATMDVSNHGAFAIQDAELSLEIPNGWTFISSEQTNYTVQSNLIKWKVNTSSIGMTQRFICYLKIPGNEPANKVFIAKATIESYGDKRLSNNLSIFQDYIRNSFDPNDKLVREIEVVESTTGYKELLYTIRFQNTGNDTAYNVIIKDALSNKLQAGSIRIVNSSHKCQLEMEEFGNAEFHFNKIYLPSVSVNPLKSNGFVQFMILPQNDLRKADYISNVAEIYFDSNSPILTNTVYTSIITDIKDAGNSNLFEIYPNPSRNEFFINYHLRIKSSALKCILTDLHGNIIYKWKLNEFGTVRMDASTLEPGVYQVIISDGNKILERKRLLRI